MPIYNICLYIITHLWPFSKSKFNLKSDCVNLVAPASPIECLLYLPNVRAIQYKLGPEKLTQLGNSNALRLPVIVSSICSFDQTFLGIFLYFWFIIIILISLNIMDNYLLSTYKVKSNQKKYSDRFSLQIMKCEKKLNEFGILKILIFIFQKMELSFYSWICSSSIKQ